MKNKLLAIFVFASALLAFSGCDKDSSAGYTRITYYPTIELLGDQVIFIDKGTAFTDPGVKSELNGEDFTDQVKVISSLDTNKPGIYTITYVATNEDGFSATASRTIYVKETAASPIASGFYTVQSGTYRDNLKGTLTPYSGYKIVILQTAPGVFYVSDFLGGYYDKRAGYGAKYAAVGYFKLNADNSLSLVSSHVDGWGDELAALNNASYDPSSKTISWVANYANMNFYVKLK